MAKKEADLTGEPIYVIHEHPVVDVGPAEWEGPPPAGVTIAPLAVEPIQSEETTHPVIDGGPAEWEPSSPRGVTNAAPPPAEPIPAHVHQHPIVDPGPAVVD